MVLGAYSAHPINSDHMQVRSPVVQIASTRIPTLTLHSPIGHKISPQPQFPLHNTGTPGGLCEG